MLKGSIVALITPFKDDNLDENTYRSLIDYHLNNGTNGIVPGGTTGESPTLSHSEHKKIIEIAVKECNGKIPVIAGTGSNSCLLYTSPSPRDVEESRMPSSA